MTPAPLEQRAREVVGMLTLAQRKAIRDGATRGWVTRNRLVGMEIAARKTRQSPLTFTDLGLAVRRLLSAQEKP